MLGAAPDTDVLTEIGDGSVLALVCDSTNVFEKEPRAPRRASPRGLLAQTMRRTAECWSTFASNAARLQTISRVAREAQRQVCVAGRSLDRILRVSQSTGYLQGVPAARSASSMRLPRAGADHRHERAGRAARARGRIASGNHELKLGEGDTVIFSSRIIPGNEVAIGRIMNQLSDLGVRIVTEQAHVHVSAIPGGPDPVEMYDWVQPEIVVPVHGEARHLPSMRGSRWPWRAACGGAEERRRDPPRSGEPGRSTKCASGGWCSTAT